MATRNTYGYFDPTAGRAISAASRLQNNFNRNNEPVISKPVPKDNPIYFNDNHHPIYDVFMHYKGYHNPEFGEWVSVCAVSKRDAELKAINVPTKKPAEKVYMKRRP